MPLVMAKVSRTIRARRKINEIQAMLDRATMSLQVMEENLNQLELQEYRRQVGLETPQGYNFGIRQKRKGATA